MSKSNGKPENSDLNHKEFLRRSVWGCYGDSTVSSGAPSKSPLWGTALTFMLNDCRMLQSLLDMKLCSELEEVEVKAEEKGTRQSNVFPLLKVFPGNSTQHSPCIFHWFGLGHNDHS